MAKNPPKALPTKAFVAIINRQVSAALTSGKQAWGRQIATLFERHALRLRAEYGGKNLWAGAAPKRKLDSWEERGWRYCFTCKQIYSPNVRKIYCSGAKDAVAHEPVFLEPIVLESKEQMIRLIKKEETLEYAE